MKKTKNIKIKLFAMVAFLVLMFVQIGPYLLYGNENELVFKYTRIDMVATNEYYNTNNLYFSRATVGDNVAYCIDYGIPLPVKSGELIKYLGPASGNMAAALINGYPNVSKEALGVNTDEEAELATQLAVWTVSYPSGDAKKTVRILDMDNLKPTTGNEEYMERVKTAAKQIATNALKNPYTAAPKLEIDHANSDYTVVDDQVIVGPYKIVGTGYDISSITVDIENKPSTAFLCDAKGNAKNTFKNYEDIYVKLNISESEQEFKLKVNSKGSHKIAKVYGTGIPDDKKQNYVFLKYMADELDAYLTIDLPELNGNIKINKVDQYKTPLKGVEFELRDMNDKVLDTKKTNSKGVVEFTNLKMGRYKVVETKPLEGYEISDVPLIFDVKHNETVGTTLRNTKIEGGLKIIKTDGDMKKPIQGVVFKVCDSTGEVVDEITTNSKGIAISKKLPAGKYYFEEKQVPPNVEVTGIGQKIDFEVKDPSVLHEFPVVNYYKKGRLTIVKSTEDKKPIQGVVFEILDSNKKVIETLTTDEKGTITTGKLLQGTYYYREKKGPNSIVIDKTLKRFTMEYSDKTVEITNNYARGQLKIIKVDEDENPVEGVVFQLYDGAKNPIGKITTDANGIAISKEYKLGKYYYQEIEVPKHLKIDKKMYEFRLAENKEIVVEKVTNEFLDRGQLKIIKVGKDGKPIEGVVFQLYDGAGNPIGKITTDANGIAVSKKFILGKYYYQEIKVPDHVKIDKTMHEFRISEDNEIVEKKVINEYIETGRLKIIKKGTNGKLIQGVIFEVYKKEGEELKLVDTLETDENGTDTTIELELGKYYYKEVKVPDYVEIKTELFEFDLSKPATIVKTVVNRVVETGKLKIIKVDDLNRPVKGVIFEVYKKEGKELKLVDTLETDENGTDTTIELELGKYYYKEVKVPDYIEIKTELFEFDLSKEGIIEKKVRNRLKRGSISIFKVDENGEYLQGVTFTLLDENENEIGSKTTGKDGIVKFEKLLPGKYNFKEVDAPTYVVADKELKPIEITLDKLNVETTVENKFARGIISILKVDEFGNKLKDVVFEILDENKNVVDTIKTDENGVVKSKPLLLGKYYYREKEAPNGIITDKKEHEFKITENEQVIEVKVTNYLNRGSISIFKVDEDGNYLKNVKFTLLDEDNHEIDSKTTDKNGIAKFENLLPGKYKFKEVDAPAFVVKDEEIKVIEITVEELNVKVEVQNKFARGTLKIHKTDYADNNLAKVTFEILDENKNVIDTIITDENGIAVSKPLKVGEYFYREVKAEDENIIVETKIQKFRITENNEVVAKEIKNKTVDGVVIITKVDSKDEKMVLEGAEIQILDENKNVIDTKTTDKNGQVKFGNLKIGKYYYKEIKAPNGYILDSNEYEFNITKKSQEATVKFKNVPKELPQTGGFISTNMLIVIIVSVVSVTGYVVITLIAKSKHEQNN